MLRCNAPLLRCHAPLLHCNAPLLSCNAPLQRCNDRKSGSLASLPVSNALLQVGAGADQGQRFSLQAGAGVMSGCNDENIARHAPLQRNNEGELFCNDLEWVSQDIAGGRGVKKKKGPL